jgi:hypothetical protein
MRVVAALIPQHDRTTSVMFAMAPRRSPATGWARRLLVPLCACASLMIGCGSNAPRSGRISGLSLADVHTTSSGSGNARSASSSAPFRFFSWWSFWNQTVPASAPVDPSSPVSTAALAGEVAAETATGEGPWINTTKYSVPIYTVAANQPTVRVKLDHLPPVPALQSAWNAVPLPPSAHPASGTDGVLVIWQPSMDRLWEFERLVRREGRWRASWGGAMQHVSSNMGVYGPAAWPGAKPWWGVSASSLSVAGGLISLEDLELGQINHAVAMAIPDVRESVYASPAHRDDGKSADPLSLPEGAHLRLNPNLDLASLHLPRVTLMIAEAAQHYGIFVRDKGANVQFFAQDPTPTGTNPYAGLGGYFEGKSPAQLLAAFPWSQLELLKMELHKTSSKR